MKQLRGQYLVTLLVFLCLICAGHVMAKSQEFADLNLELINDDVSLSLQGEILFQFSKAALEALDNGLPLAVDTEIIIKPVKKWYWQKPLLTLNYKHEIQYHALSQQYLVKGMGSNYRRAFFTRSSALIALGRVDEFPLIELVLLDPNKQYEVSIRSVLDSESLPVPLRPLTYLSEEWRLRSGWKRLRWSGRK